MNEGRRALRRAILVFYVAAVFGEAVLAVGAANFLLRQGGVRLLGIGVATTLAGLVAYAALFVLWTRPAWRSDNLERVVTRVGWATIVGGLAALVVGLRLISRNVHIDPAMTVGGALGLLVVLLPAGLRFVQLAHLIARTH